MSINVGIVDQRVRKLAEDLATEFETRLNIKNDEVKQRSTAFVFLVTRTILDLTDDDALQCLTEGGNDFGIDAIHIGDIEDGEFPVTLFQGKYKQKLEYRRQRSNVTVGPMTFTNEVAAKAVLSIWRRRPHQAKYQEREHFGRLYDFIFSKDLNGTQVVIATDIFRRVSRAEEFLRKKIFPFPFAPYASCFIAMLMGQYHLADLKIQLPDLNHLRLKEAEALLQECGPDYWERALWDIDCAVKRLYGEQDVSLQRRSATFRRGDLIAELAQIAQSAPTSTGSSSEQVS